jgi:hypothetical protein
MLNTDQNFTWWLDVGDAILIGREEAMREAGTNQPEGGRYNRLFGEWLVREKLDFDKGDRSRLLQVMDNRLAIEGWRMTLPLVERRNLNHPSTVLRKWKASTKIGELKEKRTQSNAANFLRRELDDAKAHNAELQAALDARDSSRLTAKQHFSALIELLQDEPQLALQDAVNGFCREMKRAWDVRRQAKKPLRAMTAKETEQEAGHKALSETLGELGRNLRSRGINVSFKGEGKAKPKKAKAKGKTTALEWKTEVETGLDGKDHERCEARVGKERYTIKPAYTYPDMQFGGYNTDYYPADFDSHKRPRMTTALKTVKTLDQAKAIAQAHYDKRPES